MPHTSVVTYRADVRPFKPNMPNTSDLTIVLNIGIVQTEINSNLTNSQQFQLQVIFSLKLVTLIPTTWTANANAIRAQKGRQLTAPLLYGMKNFWEKFPISKWGLILTFG